MKYTQFMDNASIYQPNARAEDGLEQGSPWSALCEYVLIPIGTVVAFFLILLCMMLLNH
jgi:hypothetical protein